MSLKEKLITHPWVIWLIQHRFLKFGTVGASGTFVNLGVLFLGQEFLFQGIESPETRLNVSLATAIFVSTLNNFFWNRTWTWRDRTRHRSTIAQFSQYASACWVGIAIQFIFTKLISIYLHYLVANITAIVIASAFNFLANDRWTFTRHRKSDHLPTKTNCDTTKP